MSLLPGLAASAAVAAAVKSYSLDAGDFAEHKAAEQSLQQRDSGLVFCFVQHEEVEVAEG